MSIHLNHLHAAGWLNQVWEGRHVRHSLHDDAARQLVELAAAIGGRRIVRVCGCFARSAGA